MSDYIHKYLYQYLPLDLTPAKVMQLKQMVLGFEIRDKHPLTLNSQLIGVEPFIFTGDDRKLLFDIIGYNESVVTNVIDKIPSINNDFRNVSDALNVMCVYVAHRLMVGNDQKLNSSSYSLYRTTAADILNYMQYRMIGSVLSTFKFQYDIMQSAIESMNKKFDIKTFESWKGIIQNRSDTALYNQKNSNQIWTEFNNDKNILNVIIDIKTKIKSQMKKLISLYIEIKDSRQFITSRSTTMVAEGEKIIRDQVNNFSQLQGYVMQRVLDKSSFVDEKFIYMVNRSIPRLSASLIRRMLITVSDLANVQRQSKTDNKVVNPNKNVSEIYTEIEQLVQHIIHVCISSAINNKSVNLNNKLSIYKNAQNLFSSPRSSNQELLNVKSSFVQLCYKSKISDRDSTISGLSITFVLYIMLICFEII